MIYNSSGTRKAGDELDGDADKEMDQAERQLLAGDERGAHQRLLARLQQDPQCHRALTLLAQIPAAHGQPSKALALLERALRTAPESPVALAFAAQQALALNRQEEARSFADRALSSPQTADAHTQDTIGVVLVRLGLHEQALPCFERALAGNARIANFHYNHASCAQFLGRFDVARRSYEACIALNAKHYRAHSALSSLVRATPEDNRVARLEQAFAAAGDGADACLHLGHALAKETEDLGRYGESFAWLQRGKARKAQALAYDGAQDQALFSAATALLQDSMVEAAPSVPAQPLLFVVGMPRTGTTLVDRLLSSHSAVASVGELTQFGLLLKRALNTPSPYVLDPQTLEASADAPLDEVAAGYLSYVTGLAPAAAVRLDKMPLNFFYLPLILRALPGARVIALRRHPMDACLSNYRQLFATRFSYYRYAYRLEDTARYYAGYDRFMAACRAQLPAERFTEVAYEDLVSEFEQQARRLLAFAGLHYEPAVLDFHRNRAPVATASSVQVRQPVYRRASGRWRRFGEVLAPLATALRDAGVVLPD